MAMNETKVAPSCQRVGGSATALGDGPVDVLEGRLDGAALAVDAVLRVDDEVRVAVGIVGVLVDAGGAEVALGRAALLERLGLLARDLVEEVGFDSQMRRLVVVVDAGPREVVEQGEREDAVRLGVVDGALFAERGRLRVARVAAAAAERPRLSPFEHVRREPRVRRAAVDAERGLEGGLVVADRAELVVDPARSQRRVVRSTRLRRIVVAGKPFLEDGFGGEHGGLHRGVRAFDLGHVDEARRAADEAAPGKRELGWNGLEAALVDDARAVPDALAAVEMLRDDGVVLEPLELLVRRDLGVRVVESDDEAELDETLILGAAHVVQEAAAVGRR
mmetsp:Transcript_7081/g.29473  ORF Transcript_7081/g.29473 Transcript_7081/m.29473 type:complete len:334 (-) Transcript_7081:782-1783(-)